MNGGYRFYEDLKVCLDAQLKFSDTRNHVIKSTLAGTGLDMKTIAPTPVIRLKPHFPRVTSFEGME